MTYTQIPIAYDITKSEDLQRLYREAAGYLKTCQQEHHGTDRRGRQFVLDALTLLSAKMAQEAK